MKDQAKRQQSMLLMCTASKDLFLLDLLRFSEQPAKSKQFVQFPVCKALLRGCKVRFLVTLKEICYDECRKRRTAYEIA